MCPLSCLLVSISCTVCFQPVFVSFQKHLESCGKTYDGTVQTDDCSQNFLDSRHGSGTCECEYLAQSLWSGNQWFPNLMQLSSFHEQPRSAMEIVHRLNEQQTPLHASVLGALGHVKREAWLEILESYVKVTIIASLPRRWCCLKYIQQIRLLQDSSSTKLVRFSTH